MVQNKDGLTIVSILNVSNLSCLDADSGYIAQQLFCSGLRDRGHTFVTVGPFKSSQDDRYHYYLNLGSTKYEVRFGFPFRQLYDILKEIHVNEGTIDWVWVNQPEIVVAVKAILAELGLKSAKILTYVHYYPILEFSHDKIKWDISLNSGGLAKIIMNRILEGCSISDLVFVHSDFSREMLLSVARINNIELSTMKVKKVPIPSDPLLFVDNPLKCNKVRKLVFGYPNRLYYHYGTSSIFTMLSEMNESLDFSVWVTNPTNNCSEIRNANDEMSKKVKEEVMALDYVEHFDEVPLRNIYRKLLKDSYIVIGPYRKTAPWSMSLVDAMGMGKPVIAPNCGAFKDMLPDGLLWNTPKDFLKLIHELISNRERYELFSLKCYEAAKELSVDKIALRIETILQGDKKLGIN